MAEIIKNGDIEKAKVSFTCPACGTEFTEIPSYISAKLTEVKNDIGLIIWRCYKFDTWCPTCGLPLRQERIFDNAAPEGGA